MNIDLDIINSSVKFWRQLAQAGEIGASLPSLAGATSGHAFETAKQFCSRLEANGFLEAMPQPKAKTKAYAIRYRVKPNQNGRASVPNFDAMEHHLARVHRNIWTVLRAGNAVTLAQIVYYGSTEELPLQGDTVKAYLDQLAEAGLLVDFKPSDIASNKKPKPVIWYRLKPSANTGPNPPKLLRAILLYDVNVGRICGSVKAVEVAA